jgi:competence protein ComEA
MKSWAETVTLGLTAVFLAASILVTVRGRAAEIVILPSAAEESAVPELSGGAEAEDEGCVVILQTVINLNTATAEELAVLPGIGETLAGRIVEYREREGPFSCLEDLLDVPGIGESTLDKIYESMGK